MQARLWRHFDILLLLATILLVAFGVAMIYSASLPTSPADTPFFDSPPGRQAIYAAIGLTLMLLAAITDYRIYGNIAPFLYCLALVLLFSVLALGQATYGARRWLDLVIFPLQPSEIVKLVMVLVLGKYLSDHQDRVKSVSVLATSLLILLLPAALVYFQPHFSTLIILTTVWLAMVVMAGARLLHLAGAAVVGILASPLVYLLILQGYMRQRLSVFFSPASDPLGAGYASLQAQISVGSGGLWGKGFTAGTQSQLHFLRIQKTDFIFSVLGEELGFVGALILFGLFLVLLFRGLRIAAIASDLFGRLVATGIVVVILVQVFINVGANLGLLPITGIPLPFISYGGSSLLTLLFALGILESIAMRQKKIEF